MTLVFPKRTHWRCARSVLMAILVALAIETAITAVARFIVWIEP